MPLLSLFISAVGLAVAFYLANHTVNVAIIGDSITSQMSPRQGTFPVPFVAATNLGVSGNTTAQVLARVASIPASTTHVVLQMGTNDLVGLGTDTTIIPNYTSMLNAIPSTMRVIILGILPVDEAQLAISNPTYPPYLSNAKIHYQNTAITTLCNTYSNCVVASGIMAKNMSGKTADGIHPTASADIEIITAIMPLLGL